MAVELDIRTNVETGDASAAIDKLSGKIENLEKMQEKTLKEQRELGKQSTKALNDSAKATNGLAAGFKGVGLAIKAAGIGLLLSVLSTVIDLFKENQRVVDFFTTAFNALAKVVNDFVEFVSSGKALDAITNFFKNFEFSAAYISKAAAEIAVYTEQTIKAAEAQTQLANSSRIAQAEQQRLIEQYDRQAEQLRQIRDNEELSLQDRIAANEKLGEVLNEQAEAELALVEIRVKSAQQDLANTDNIENQVALIEALTAQDEVLARVEGFRSEQIINQVSLRKELNEELSREKMLRDELANISPIEQRGLEQKEDPEVEAAKRRNDQLDKLNKALRKQNQDFAKEDVEIQKNAAAEKLKIEQLRAQNQLALEAGVFNALTALAEEGSAEAKAFAVAQVVFDTYKGIQATFASAAANPSSILFPGYPFVQAGLAAAFGFANVRKILSAPTSGGSGGSVSVGSGGGGGGGQAQNQQLPNFEFINQGVGGQQNAEFGRPIRAYVVNQNIKDENALADRINDNAKLN